MITIADIPEMIEDLRKGDLRIVDVEYLILDLFVENEAADILPLLPDDVKQRVRAMLHETFPAEASEDDLMIRVTRDNMRQENGAGKDLFHSLVARAFSGALEASR